MRIITDLLKLQSELELQQTDQEDQYRNSNIRIHLIAEGSEKNLPPMMHFVEIIHAEKMKLKGTRFTQIKNDIDKLSYN